MRTCTDRRKRAVAPPLETRSLKARQMYQALADHTVAFADKALEALETR